MPSCVARHIPPDESLEDRANRHCLAAAALTPYVIGGQGALSMAVDSVFAPQYFVEAHHHLRQAMHYLRKAGSSKARRLRNLSGEAIRRIARFVMPPSWANVSRLLIATNGLYGSEAMEPYEKACELLKWHEEAQIPPHPFNLVTAAASAIRAASCISLYVDDPDVPIESGTRLDESPLQLHSKAREFYFQALRRCNALPKNERNVTRLFCLTKYLVYLCQLHWVLLEEENPSDRKDKETEIRLIWSQIVDFMNDGVKLLTEESLECFKLMGDREADHGKALDVYLRGMVTDWMWAPLSLKTWGAASLCGKDNHLSSMLTGFPARQKGHLIYKAFYNSALRGTKALSHERMRLGEGLRVFEHLYGEDPHVQAAKAACERDYGRDAIRRWAEDECCFLRGLVTDLEHDEKQGVLRSENGRLYRFQAVELADGLTYLGNLRRHGTRFSSKRMEEGQDR